MTADQPEWTAPPEAVVAFLDGDGCGDEAFTSLRRRLTLATPWILDSAAGTDYTARKLAEAERRGAVKELSLVVALIHRDLAAMSNSAATEPARNALADVALGIEQRITRIESGEMPL